MARRKTQFNAHSRVANQDLAKRLAIELTSDHEGGQPFVEEQEFPSGSVRVTVIWDAWDQLPLDERTSVILRAYELAGEHELRQRIALASGLTVPEAHAAGMLPFQVIPALRKGDPVTPEQCRAAMISEGASTLMGEQQPVLRFSTDADAEATRRRLANRLPGSELVWLVTQEVGRVEDWAGQL